MRYRLTSLVADLPLGSPASGTHLSTAVWAPMRPPRHGRPAKAPGTSPAILSDKRIVSSTTPDRFLRSGGLVSLATFAFSAVRITKDLLPFRGPRKGKSGFFFSTFIAQAFPPLFAPTAVLCTGLWIKDVDESRPELA